MLRKLNLGILLAHFFLVSFCYSNEEYVALQPTIDNNGSFDPHGNLVVIPKKFINHCKTLIEQIEEEESKGSIVTFRLEEDTLINIQKDKSVIEISNLEFTILAPQVTAITLPPHAGDASFLFTHFLKLFDIYEFYGKDSSYKRNISFQDYLISHNFSGKELLCLSQQANFLDIPFIQNLFYSYAGTEEGFKKMYHHDPQAFQSSTRQDPKAFKALKRDLSLKHSLPETKTLQNSTLKATKLHDLIELDKDYASCWIATDGYHSFPAFIKVATGAITALSTESILYNLSISNCVNHFDPLQDHRNVITTVKNFAHALSEDKSQYVLLLNENITFYDSRTRSLLKKIKLPTIKNALSSNAAFAVNIVSLGQDPGLIVLDFKNNTCKEFKKRFLSNHLTDQVLSLAISDNGKYCLVDVKQDEYSFFIINTENGKEYSRPYIRANELYPPFFIFNKNDLLISTQDGIVKIDCETLKEQLIYNFPFKNPIILNFRLEKEQNIITICDKSGACSLLDANTYELITHFPYTGAGVYQIIFSPDGTCCTITYDNGETLLYNIAQGSCVTRLTKKDSFFSSKLFIDDTTLLDFDYEGTKKIKLIASNFSFEKLYGKLEREELLDRIC